MHRIYYYIWEIIVLNLHDINLKVLTFVDLIFVNDCHVISGYEHFLSDYFSHYLTAHLVILGNRPVVYLLIYFVRFVKFRWEMVYLNRLIEEDANTISCLSYTTKQ